ncbi:MAG TPA: CheR family methyltransferase [Steroidobacteraceae bacterium]
MRKPDESEQIEAARLQICSILRSQLGHDFSGYRDKTFLRRVRRRMQVVGVDTFDDYVTWLHSHAPEVVLLFRDLLIRVTSFFRDKHTFDALERIVVPRLFAGKEADGSVRIWIPGCATGEEAYSLAILMHEHMMTLRGVPKVQIFATDIDESAIATARLGRYPETLLEGLSSERRDRYFIKSQGSYLVSKDIRELCTFSSHNVVRDPPFSRMDLVSCRNLLIYMDPELQGAVIPIFHYSLVPRGILLLGGSESAARHENLFTPLDKGSRIFERCDVRSPSLNLNLNRPNLNGHRALLESRPPAGINPPPADYSVMAEESQVVQEPLANPELPAAKPPASNAPPLRFSRLRNFFKTRPSIGYQQRLHTMQEQFQALAEEHQTALEELRSTNEELHSVNEEMQSANEELETSKEELQSVNEELHTVNSRLTEKVDELDETNSDLRNLFEGTEIATIFLDRQLIIRSFTPAIATLYNLIPSDQGRPLTDIVTKLDYAGMRADVAHVLETLQPLERQVAQKDRSAHFIMRVLPYREPDSTVSGVLVTFVDVTSIVEAESALREADVRKDVFLATLSHELRNPLAPIRTAALILNSPRLAPEGLSRAQAIISRQVIHMSSLLDDLLDVSRITSGTFALKREYVDVQTLLDAAIEAVQPAIDAKGHTLRVESLGTPAMLEVDPVRMTQVISNLLTNAAKYTRPGGTITLGTRLEPGTVVVFVRDSGIGLAPEALQSIFNMFTRIQGDIDRSEGGLGIGLALSKGLIELHHGKIEVRSAGPGQGSEFWFSIPRSREIDAPKPMGSQSLNETLHVTRRVLIADDNRDGAETLSMFLQMAGHELFLAHTGTEALEMAARQRPEIGILDIGLPDMTGYEIAKRIRQEAWGSNMLLIAVTGWGQEEDKRAARVAGFDHHLTKPVDPAQLERLFDAERAAATGV